MTERKTITFWLAVNEDGEYHVDQDSATDAADGISFNAVRIVEVSITLDLPTVETVNVAVAIPAETKAPAQVTVS